MRLDRDTFREILDSLLRNRSRSLLTGFGVFWGVFMLMLLVGGGQGLKQLLEKNFDGFAQNTCIVYPEQTSKAYKGYQKGRWWGMTETDVDRVRAMVPELEIVTPIISRWGQTAVKGENTASGSMKGVTPEYAGVETPKIRYGRYINQMDLADEKKVCVIGKRIYEQLFPEGGDPTGQRIAISGIYYTVVGVDYNEGNMSVNGRATETISVPYTTMRKAYNFGKRIGLLCVTAKPGVEMSSVIPRIRSIIQRAHSISPDDNQAVQLINTQLIFGIVDNLFKGINFLIWLIGLGTLLAGAIGVSNIMMVSVRERTVEIGIRRAIGATPRQILGQIMSESVILTVVAGMMGIVVSVGILAAVELAMTQDGVLKAAFQVPFSTAVTAALLLTVLGVLAGLMPAVRAMGIKPVDAMRDE